MTTPQEQGEQAAAGVIAKAKAYLAYAKKVAVYVAGVLAFAATMPLPDKAQYWVQFGIGVLTALGVYKARNAVHPNTAKRGIVHH